MVRPLRLPLPFYNENFVRFAAPYGDDSSDGYDGFRYPKQTIYGCIDSLIAACNALGIPPRGTIFYLDGTYVGNEVGGYVAGLWLSDAPTLPDGFKRMGGGSAFSFVGVGGRWSQFGYTPAAFKMGKPGGSTTHNPNHQRDVALWMYQTSAGCVFDSVRTDESAKIQMRLGVTGDPALDPMADTELSRGNTVGVDTVEFLHCWSQGDVSSMDSMGIDIGSVFWCRFFRSHATGNPTVDINSELRYGWRVHPYSGGSSVVELEHVTAHTGGLRYVAGGSSWGFEVNEMIVESYNGETMPPAVWASSLGPSGGAKISRANKADESLHDPTIPTTRLQGSITPDQVEVNLSGPVEGPHTVIGDTFLSERDQTKNPAYNAAVGYAFNRWWGDNNVLRNAGPPVSQRFRNLWPARDNSGVPIPYSSLQSTGTTSVTTGQTDRYGGTNAIKIAQTAAGVGWQSIWQPSPAQGFIPAGTRMVFGLWTKAPSGYDQQNFHVDVGMQDFGTGHPAPTVSWVGGKSTINVNESDGEWQWNVIGCTVTANAFPGTDFDVWLQVHVAHGHDVTVSHPVVLFLPPGTLSDNDFAELVQQCPPYADLPPVGSVATQAGQKFIAQGGLGVGNSISTAGHTFGAATTAIEVFDVSGNSLGWVQLQPKTS